MEFYFNRIRGLFLAQKFGSLPAVFFSKKHKPRERFYLLPGQGGRNYHIKQQRIMRWVIAIALFFGLIMGTIMWWVSKPRF